MLNSDNYELEHRSENRSKGTSLGQTYDAPATDAEKKAYFDKKNQNNDGCG